MNGRAVNNHAILNGKLRPIMQLKGIVSIPGGYEHYFGEYEITPKIEEQRCLTKNKVMSKDITVKSIPTYEVTNLQGGTTFIIGGDSVGARMIGQPKVRRNLFVNCPDLEWVEISQEAKSIEQGAFQRLTKLPQLNIPASVESIERQAFLQCVPLPTITFLGTPTTIDATAFVQCAISTINVPWAEGAVANAPWGATNATINYNYVAPES